MEWQFSFPIASSEFLEQTIIVKIYRFFMKGDGLWNELGFYQIILVFGNNSLYPKSTLAVFHR